MKNRREVTKGRLESVLRERCSFIQTLMTVPLIVLGAFPIDRGWVNIHRHRVVSGTLLFSAGVLFEVLIVVGWFILRLVSKDG
jgi:hypothetical protein